MAITRRTPIEETTRWRPWRDLEDLSERFNQMLSSFGRFEETRGGGFADWSPKVDITETDTEYLVSAELPGVKKEDVHVSVEGGELMIRGERHEMKEEKGRKIHRVERSYGSFYRAFDLPADVDPQQVDARYDNGILNLHLPKTGRPAVKGKEIEIH